MFSTLYCCLCNKKIPWYSGYFSADELNFLLKQEYFSSPSTICYRCGKHLVKQHDAQKNI